MLLGRLLPDYFPKIFGPSEKEPLDIDASRAAFEKVVKEVNDSYGSAEGDANAKKDRLVPVVAVPKDMQGELEIVVLPVDSHRLFPGQRTVVRFRLVG